MFGVDRGVCFVAFRVFFFFFLGGGGWGGFDGVVFVCLILNRFW